MNSTKEKEEKIAAVYYTVKNSASFSGPQKIYKSLKDKGENISLGDIKKWFKKQENYGLHKRIHRKFKRNRFISYKTDYIWDAEAFFTRFETLSSPYTILYNISQIAVT